MPTLHLTMNTIDLGYVIPGAYSGLSWIMGCSSLCCTKQASVGTRIDQLVLLGGAAVSAAPNKLRLMNYCSVGALETSAPPMDTKKGLQSRLTLKTSSKEGSHLLSRIALQYHRRKRA